MRLIDADVLLDNTPEWMNEYHPEHAGYNRGWNACNAFWRGLIKDQPTAFDVEKVVERLEVDGAEFICGDGYDAEGRLESIIEIVKGGVFGETD